MTCDFCKEDEATSLGDEGERLCTRCARARAALTAVVIFILPVLALALARTIQILLTGDIR